MKKRLISILAAGVFLLGSASALLPVHAEGTWSPIRGYSGAQGSISEADGVISLTGYGGAKYSERIPVVEGTSISMTISPENLLAPGYNNLFAIALLNVEGSFFGGAADTGAGFAISAKSFGNYADGFNLWYTKAAGQQLGQDVRIGDKNIQKDMAATDLYITLTKKAQTVDGVACSWEIRITNSQTTDEMVYRVPAADVPDDLFADGAYLVAGHRQTANKAGIETVRVNIRDLTITQPATITVKIEVGDRTVQLGEEISLTMADVFNVPAGKTAVYTVSHGTVADGVWRYTPAAAGTEDITISAGFSAGEAVATVTFRLTAQQEAESGAWSPIRGYAGEQQGITESDGVTAFNGFGGAKYNEPIPVEEGTAISMTLSPKGLSSHPNLFSIALLDTEDSFFAGAADTGSGFTVCARDFSQYQNGFNLWYQTVSEGKATPLDTAKGSNRINKADGSAGNINNNMIESAMRITLVKKAQTIDGVDYSWEIRIAIEPTKDELLKLVPAGDVPEDLFADGAYLVAGCNSGKVIRVEMSGLEITQPDADGITLIGEAPDRQADKGETLTLDLTDIFMVSGDRTLTYTASAGEIKDGVWSYTFAGGEAVEVTITAAIDGTEIQKTIQFRIEENAVWQPLRGYTGALGSLTATDGTDVVLDGYGAARLSTPIPIKEGTKVRFTLTLPVLNKVDNNPFAVALVNDPDSFLGGQQDTASGLAFMVKSFSDYEKGYNLWYCGVKDGRADNFLRLEERNAQTDLTKAKLVVTMEKKTQTVDGVKYGWVITVTDETSGEAYTQLVPADEVPDEVFAGKSAYLVAGCRSGKPIRAQLSGITVTEPVEDNTQTGVAAGSAAAAAVVCAALPAVMVLRKKSRKKGVER